MKILLLILLFIAPWSNNTITTEVHPNMLFYIERNMNSNTVIYEAFYDSNGELQKHNPIKAHWIMFEKNGENESLNYMEQKMAYGIKCTPDKSAENSYNVKLVADENRTFILKQTAAFSSRLTTVLKGKEVQLTRMFIEADNSSFWPAIKYILLEGKDLKSGDIISEKVIPNN